MPAKSVAQVRWAQSCLHNPKHRGSCPSDDVAREFAHKPPGKLPERVRKKK